MLRLIFKSRRFLELRMLTKFTFSSPIRVAGTDFNLSSSFVIELFPLIKILLKQFLKIINIRSCTLDSAFFNVGFVPLFYISKLS